MKSNYRMTLLAALMASVGLVAAGCGDTNRDRVSTRTERAADKVAANTERAADKATTAVGDAAIHPGP